MRRTVPVHLGNAEFLIETVAAPETGAGWYDPEGLTPVGADDTPESFHRIRDMIEAVTGELAGAIASAKPQEAVVEFGVAADVKAGKLTGILVGGGASATLKVTLKWTSTPDGE